MPSSVVPMSVCSMQRSGSRSAIFHHFGNRCGIHAAAQKKPRHSASLLRMHPDTDLGAALDLVERHPHHARQQQRIDLRFAMQNLARDAQRQLHHFGFHLLVVGAPLVGKIVACATRTLSRDRVELLLKGSPGLSLAFLPASLRAAVSSRRNLSWLQRPHSAAALREPSASRRQRRFGVEKRLSLGLRAGARFGSGLDDVLIFAVRSQADLAFRFQLARHGHRLLLRLDHVARPHRPQHFHVFFQHLDGARRHGLENVDSSAPRVAPRKRHGQRLLVELRQQLANAGLGHSQQVLEGEHQVANAERQLGIVLLDGFQNGLWSATGSSRFSRSATPCTPA